MATMIVNSPAHSSEDEYEEDSTMIEEGPWQAQSTHGMSYTSPSMDGSNPSIPRPTPKAPIPMQKRRRVTRACDECRRKKIKCDGKQPCTHCTVYSYGK